jgi:hypothetical protein
MPRCATLLAAAAAVVVTFAAQAQLQRNFPAHALRGELTIVQGADARLNGRAARLAPGARIRDTNNLLVMSGAIAGQTLPIHYTLESNGMLLDVWLLTREERARQPWPVTLAEAKAWSFDPVGQTWTRR